MTARSALATTVLVTMGAGKLAGRTRSSSSFTAPTLARPATWTADNEKLEQHASRGFVNAGVKKPNEVELSTSSAMRFCAWTTSAVTVTSMVRYGASLGVPNVGRFVWALV